jgi:uncharacterized protein
MESTKNGHQKLLTTPEAVSTDIDYYPTGNEYVSLPETDSYGNINSVNLLRLDHHGLFEFSGDIKHPLLAPSVKIDGKTSNCRSIFSWHYNLGWLPTFSCEVEKQITLKGTIVAPPGFKGFFYQLSIENGSTRQISIELGWIGCWAAFNYCVFSRRKLSVQQKISLNKWTGCLVLEASSGAPIAALSLAASSASEWHINQENGQFKTGETFSLLPGEAITTTIYGAINLEKDGAATTNIDLRRHGAKTLLDHTERWLGSRYLKVTDPAFEVLINKNLFFAYFYSTARSLEDEQLVSLTSRSPRYYVSAAFWSRDALLWSFPAIMLVDYDCARELLLTIFDRHIRHAGEHAHYLNGTILYPGFELDQLAAYVIALQHYLDLTGDAELFEENVIRKGLTVLTAKALERFDPGCGLYSSFLDPSDDPVDYPYLTYSNALLQRAFVTLDNLQNLNLYNQQNDFAMLARELEKAIYEHCTVQGPDGLMFAWAVNGKGKFSLYDNPPGSLQLLTYYRFCAENNRVFLNTVRWIRSTNNPYFNVDGKFEEAGSLHCSNPWPLGAINDLWACNAGALDFLKRAKMDNGFFCETIDPDSGKVSTGAAFASAAGFLAFSLYNNFTIMDRGGNNRCSQ